MPRMKLIGQGNTSEIFEWNNNTILKLYHNEMPNDLCVHEFEITKYVYEHLKITPKPIEIINIDGRIGAVYEKLNGKTMLNMMLLKPWNISKYSKMLANYHITMQKNAKGDIQTLTVKEKLKQDIESVSLLSIREKELIYKYLGALPDGDTICHFDFHPDNIMVSSNQFYVIDWMTGCVGDPLSDIARTALILNYAEIPRVPFFINVMIGVFQKSVYRIYLREYLRLTGTDISDIQKWELPIAAARLCECIPKGESRRLVRFIKTRLDVLTDKDVK